MALVNPRTFVHGAAFSVIAGLTVLVLGASVSLTLVFGLVAYLSFILRRTI